MGEDFAFANARKSFTSSDNLIKFWNENLMNLTNIELKYSTPSIYIDAVASEDITWPTRYDDLFPYADYDVAWWTGYFTSKANDKKYFRDGATTLYSANKLFALAALDAKTTDDDISDY
jgi:hypothetical protein